MRDVETLLKTINAYQRKKLIENEHKGGWHDADYSGLIIGMHGEKYEWLSELADPNSTPESLWGEAADLCNFICFITDRAVKRKMEAAENKPQP